MIKIRDKHALFLGMNFVAFLFSLVYLILNNLGIQAVALSARYRPHWETGLFVYLTFAQIIFVTGLTIVLIYDMWWLHREINNYNKIRRKERRDNL